MMCRRMDDEALPQAIAAGLLLLLAVVIWLCGCNPTFKVEIGGTYYDGQAKQKPPIVIEIPERTEEP